MQETLEMWVQSLGWEDPQEQEMAPHSSLLAWEIPWAEEPGGLQSIGLQIVRHDLATKPPPPQMHSVSFYAVIFLGVWATPSCSLRQISMYCIICVCSSFKKGLLSPICCTVI